MAAQDELAYMPATEIAARIARRDLSPVEVVDAFLDGIARRNKSVNAYVLVLHEEARRLAREAEKAVGSGATLGPLHGVPIAIKDLFDFKAGVPNTFGCKPFKDWTPAVSATYVTRLEEGGAVARPDAFMLAVPFAHAGPIARSVADAALMLGVMSGPDDRDPYSLPGDGADYAAATRRPVAGMRVAWSPDLGVFPIDPEVARVTREAVAAFEEAGAHVEEVRVGFKRSQEELCGAWMRQSAVRSAQTADGFKTEGIDLLGSHRDQISPEFAASLELGWSQSALDYRRDDVIRTEVLDALQDVFDECDILVCPTLAGLPVDNATDGNTLGPAEIQGHKVDRLLGWCLTYPFNFAGHPAASIPAGLSSDGLPVGLQIAGRRFADESVLAASAAFEQARPWAATYLSLSLEGRGSG